jgi:hypothetical protein
MLTNAEKLEASMAMLMGDSFTKGHVTIFPVDGPTRFCVMQMIGPADKCKKFETGYWPAALEKFEEFTEDAIAQSRSQDTLSTKGGEGIAAETTETTEAEQNFAAWMAVTGSSRHRWTEDGIYRLNGRGAFYYTGGEDGIYMRIGKDGTLEAGDYEGAIPHIGEAMFKPVVTKQFAGFGEAYTRAVEAGGKRFLTDMFGGSEPQPLVHITGRAAPEEKPSVLKQIREAQKIPKPPRRENAPDKNKGDLEH